MAIHKEADRLSNQLEPVLVQHAGDAFAGLSGEKGVRMQAGVERGCVTVTQAEAVQPGPEALATGVRLDLQVVGLQSRRGDCALPGPGVLIPCARVGPPTTTRS